MLSTFLFDQLIVHLLGLLGRLSSLLYSLSLDLLNVEDLAPLLDCISFLTLAHKGWVFGRL